LEDASSRVWHVQVTFKWLFENITRCRLHRKVKDIKKERKKNKTMVIRELKLGSDLPSITGVDIYK
jgi:hypothetical protein